MKKVLLLLPLLCALCACSPLADPHSTDAAARPDNSTPILDFTEEGISLSETEEGAQPQAADAWPQTDATAELPQPAEGKVVSVLKSETGIYILLENMPQAAAENYLQQVKESGFVLGADEQRPEGGYKYSATKENGYYLILQYESATGKCSIQIELAAG